MLNDIYPYLSMLLCYPDGGQLEALKRIEEITKKSDVTGLDASELKAMSDYLLQTSRRDIEEDYTRTYDINCVCPLEIGYILFGEDYKRGEFLVRAQELHQEFDTPLVNNELADYLPNILMLIPVMKEDDLKKDFIEMILLPALERMVETFKTKDKTNPLSLPLKWAKEVLEHEYQLNPSILEANYE